MASSASRKVLITGGTGFIGQWVVTALRAREFSPVIFDRHYVPRDPTTETIMGSVSDKVAVDHAVSGVGGVIHLAAQLGTQETVEYPDFAFETNVRGSLNVFGAVRHYGVPAVYISVGNYWMDNPYSISKHTAERIALMFNREHGTQITIVRGYNAYGPGQKVGPVRKIIPNFIVPALKDEAITIYGDGTQIMDMIYVADLAEILVDALEQSQEGVIEAGTGRPTTVHLIAEKVRRAVGKGQLTFAPMRPGETEHAIVLANPPHPKATTTLEEGLDRTIPYYAEMLETTDHL